MHRDSNEVLNITKDISKRFLSSLNDVDLSIFNFEDQRSSYALYDEDCKIRRTLEPHKVQHFERITSTSLQKYRLTQMDCHRSSTKENQKTHGSKKFNEDYPQWEKDSKSELLKIIEKAISRLCFSEELRACDKDYAVEVRAIYEMLKNKTGVKYTMLKDAILEQLLTAISTSVDDTVVRASVSILTTVISANVSVVEDIKKKGLQLKDLASALKRNVHEAAILIYLIKPSPTEIKTLDLLPMLVEVVCTSNICKGEPESSLLTPPAASLMIIEVLVTAFDNATNNMHLATINSPRVLSGLLDVARQRKIEELISLATVLVKCMQFDGQCRKYLSELTPVAPLICLLQSNEKRAMLVALEFFHEILCMPRYRKMVQIRISHFYYNYLKIMPKNA